MKWLRGHESDQYRFHRLAIYNSEVARGIVHTAEYDAEMALDQRLFDDLTYGPGSHPPPPPAYDSETEGGRVVLTRGLRDPHVGAA